MRTLISGGSGFVGSRLADRLSAVGAETLRLARNAGDRKVDLRDFAAVRAAVVDFRPDVVFHCAMTAGHPVSAEARLESLGTAVMGTAHLAEASAEAGVRRFVHLGSFLGYQPQQRAIVEGDPIGPVTPRGSAKAAASLWLRQFAESHAFPAIELRIFSVYGPGEPEHRFIPALLRAARTGAPLPLLRGPSHDFVFVDDVVEACLRAAEVRLEPATILNIAGGKAWKNEEVVETARQATGRPIHVEENAYPAKQADAPFWLADISSAARLLGWKPAHDLREGLSKTYLCPN